MTSAAKGPAVPKGLTVTALLLIAAALYLAASQTWVHAQLAGEGAAISGADAQPVLTAMAATAGAAALFLSLAGRIGRWAASIVLVLAGIGYIASALQVIREPRAVGGSALSEATGLIRTAESAQLTAWPWLGMAAAALLIVFAVLAAVGGRAWSSAGRRFERQKSRGKDGDSGVGGGGTDRTGADDAVDSWDALSRGEDPTGP
ncbi:Trp biosynthesis-associated membrane protein [Sediminivirga luteola]|uniref:Membrane protein (TIGR02234 family) n=1 Tax=Sediminivirga luteola TaxID=1774748 RepID=A0A8J2TYZ0_9MICO|nr:Trp biosynthesis-associated membrane protein [Sediminivirga luteola]MCI2264132.1 Trp biosynthesis-associated membrane protein [Sediminivirga luteola]GGA17910.1 hypothetical protein GCM10011333_21320 [Sediminivirga luteola]